MSFTSYPKLCFNPLWHFLNEPLFCPKFLNHNSIFNIFIYFLYFSLKTSHWTHWTISTKTVLIFDCAKTENGTARKTVSSPTYYIFYSKYLYFCNAILAKSLKSCQLFLWSIFFLKLCVEGNNSPVPQSSTLLKKDV